MRLPIREELREATRERLKTAQWREACILPEIRGSREESPEAMTDGLRGLLSVERLFFRIRRILRTAWEESEDSTEERWKNVM